MKSEIELIECLHVRQMRQLQPGLEIALPPCIGFCHVGPCRSKQGRLALRPKPVRQDRVAAAVITSRSSRSSTCPLSIEGSAIRLCRCCVGVPGGMIGPPLGARIWIAAGVTNLRRGFTGLSAAVQTVLEQDSFVATYLYFGRRGDLINLL